MSQVPNDHSSAVAWTGSDATLVAACAPHPDRRLPPSATGTARAVCVVFVVPDGSTAHTLRSARTSPAARAEVHPFDSFPLAALVTDGWQLLRANRACRTLLRLPADPRQRGCPWQDAVLLDDAATASALSQQLRRAARGASACAPGLGAVLRLHAAQPQPVWLAVASWPAAWTGAAPARRPDAAGDPAERARAARDHERRHLAQDLHDDLGQQLAAVKLALGAIAQSASGPRTAARVGAVLQQVDRSIASVRRIASGLRHGDVPPQAFGPAIEALVASMASPAGLQTVVHVDVGASLARCDPASPAADPHRALYRIAQEALTNVMRHAGAHRVWVRVQQDPRQLELRIEDDGTGIARPQAAQGRGCGLRGMRERAAALGGRLHVRKRRGGGTCVRVCVPLGPPAPAPDG